MPRNNIKATSIPAILSLPAQTNSPVPPSAGDVALYTRRRAGYDFLEIMRAAGRDIAMQPHFGVNRVAIWAPNSTTSITTLGLPNAVLGARSTPTPTAGSLAVSSRRWIVSSAATAGSAASDRGSSLFMWRGTEPGLGGFISILRFRVSALQVGANGFFGLMNSSGSVSLLDLTSTSGTLHYVGAGFKQGVHTNWQVAFKGEGTGAANFIDLGPDFPVDNLDYIITLYVFSPQNGESLYVRAVREDTGAIAEFELSDQALIPPRNSMMTPRLHMDNGPTAAAVAFACYGVYCETDY